MYIGSTDVCWRGCVFDLFGIFAFSHPLSHLFPFLSLFLDFFFDVPSEPHAHGCARLKIWNQCDQNGCYGRAPVYRTVSVRPGAGPRRKEEIRWRKVLSNDSASSPRVYHEIASLRTNSREGWLIVLFSWFHITSISRFKHKKDVCEQAVCRAQTDRETSCFDGLEDEIPRPYEVRPRREIDAFSCLHAAYISLRKNNN